MHGQDGPGHDASQGQVSAARRFGKPAEDVEDVRLALEIVLRDVAPGAVDLSQASATRAMRP
jgi:hypothetical protein